MASVGTGQNSPKWRIWPKDGCLRVPRVMVPLCKHMVPVGNFIPKRHQVVSGRHHASLGPYGPKSLFRE
jgi:hypothetical protein